MVLASQIAWSESCENALQAISSSSNPNDLEPMLKVLRVVEATLNILADSVLQEQPPVRRRKLEHLASFSLWFRFVVFIFELSTFSQIVFPKCHCYDVVVNSIHETLLLVFWIFVVSRFMQSLSVEKQF